MEGETEPPRKDDPVIEEPVEDGPITEESAFGTTSEERTYSQESDDDGSKAGKWHGTNNPHERARSRTVNARRGLEPPVLDPSPELFAREVGDRLPSWTCLRRHARSPSSTKWCDPGRTQSYLCDKMTTLRPA
jgi:hypothetical protein